MKGKTINPELNLLNHIIKTEDIVSPLNADCAKSFLIYNEEFEYLKEHYIKYRQVPPADVFADKFPNLTIYNTDASMAFYIDEIHKYKARHELQEIITEAAASVKEYGPYSTINKIHARLSKLGRDTKLVRDLDLVANSDERLENLKERIALRASGKQLIGIPSGFKAIDDAFGGWQQGDFIVVAGWTGSLKSWLCLFFGAHAWSQGYRVLYISLEMSGLQIGYRFDTLLSGGMFSNTGLTHADGIMFDKYKTWLGDSMKDKPPFVVVTNEDLEDVNQSTVLSKIEQWKPDLCILDYHHLFDDASGATGETEKAQPLDANLLTPNGWKLMGDIQIGDEVIGSDGKPTKVTGIAPQGIKPIYRVTMTDGSSTECCDEHLWSVNTRTRKCRGNTPLILSTETIANDIYSSEGNAKWFIPIVDPVQLEAREVPVDPYTLGYLLGDGSFRGSGLHLSTADSEIIKFVTDSLPENHQVVKRKEPDKYGYYITGPGGKGNNKLTNGIRSLGLWGHRGETKFIPELYLNNSEFVRREILAGLLDSDGCAACGVTTITSTSYQLIKDIKSLVNSLGGTGTISIATTTGLPSWKLNIKIMENPFRLTRKREQWSVPTKYLPNRGIKSIEYVGDKEAQCIRVSNFDGLYVTDDYIITHNTKNLSKAFKRIALRTGVPIIDITSVTQDKKDMGESPPQLFDLAWSKQLAYDSDLTLGLCRQGDVLEVISRKSRRSKEIHFYIDWDVDKGNVKEIQHRVTGR